MNKTKLILIIITASMILCSFASCISDRTENKDTTRENGFNIPNKGDWYGDSLDSGNDNADPDGKKDPGAINPYEKAPSEFVIGHWTGAVWGDNVFYSYNNGSGREIRYQNVKSIGTTGMPLYADVLTSDAFTMDTVPVLLINETATVENGGMPVLVIAYGVRDGNGYRYRIVSFNTLTNKVIVIQENISQVTSMSLYRDTLYYTTQEDEDIGRILHKINLDGRRYVSLDGADRVVDLSLGWIDNGIVYYSDGVTGEVFTCDLELKNSRLLFKVESIPLEPIIKFVYGGYIYYREMHSSTDPLGTGDIKRRPLNNIGQSEVFLEGAGGDMFDGKLLYIYDDTGWDVLYEYDPVTGETRTLYDVRDQGMDLSYDMYSEKYLLCMTYGNSRYDIYYICFDLESGEQMKIPQ